MVVPSVRDNDAVSQIHLESICASVTCLHRCFTQAIEKLCVLVIKELCTSRRLFAIGFSVCVYIYIGPVYLASRVLNNI